MCIMCSQYRFLGERMSMKRVKESKQSQCWLVALGRGGWSMVAAKRGIKLKKDFFLLRQQRFVWV